MPGFLRCGGISLFVLAGVVGSAANVSAAVVTIQPLADNSIFQGDGNRSCGVGPLFAGATLRYGARRALVTFDVAAAVPPGASVTAVQLVMTVEGSGPNGQDSDVFALHRVVSDWGEAASLCINGTGALAEPGDVTWDFRHFDSDPWVAGGGDFDAIPSGASGVPTTGLATWSSQPGMVADVQSWLDVPGGNHGWIVVGPEAATGTAREFHSREDVGPPTLTIQFTAPPAPPPAVPDGRSGSPVAIGKLSRDGADLRISWDTSLCSGNTGHHIVFGTRSGFPVAPNGPFGLAGSVCQVGPSSPFDWMGSPDPAVLDPATRLLFLLVLADDGATTEGSWGLATPPQERTGPGQDGSSAQCGMATKSLANSCGTGF